MTLLKYCWVTTWVKLSSSLLDYFEKFFCSWKNLFDVKIHSIQLVPKLPGRHQLSRLALNLAAKWTQMVYSNQLCEVEPLLSQS